MKSIFLILSFLLSSMTITNAGNSKNIDAISCKFYIEKKLNNKNLSFKSYQKLKDGSFLFTYKNVNSMGYPIPKSEDLKFKCIPPKLVNYKSP
ncbi:hypothetical protein B9T31_15815 [Acinetobacter sp. ANC 4558]|nr:hypothetical protein B9T31_15815 [Acinetobacter sp. ANC 4558]